MEEIDRSKLRMVSRSTSSLIFTLMREISSLHSPKMKVIIYAFLNDVGFTKLLDSGYDDKNDLYYIIMGKLDMDLSEMVKRAPVGHLSLQTCVNLGLELVNYIKY